MLDLSRSERFFLLTFLILGLFVTSFSFYKKIIPPLETHAFNIDKKLALIDINTAHAVELERLPGIGPVLALRIIDYRENLGSFRDIEELNNINGIGEKKFEVIKGLVIVNEQ